MYLKCDLTLLYFQAAAENDPPLCLAATIADLEVIIQLQY